MKWKVCPIQGRQLKDVRPEDIMGHFRICSTYRGGGGYDQFPYILIRRRPYLLSHLKGNPGIQFVVQLFGCHLNCPYCYVTRDGIFGDFIEYSSKELVDVFLEIAEKRGCGVFHLMGGAPALYHKHWYEILDILPSEYVFHSDLLLTEMEYDINALTAVRSPNALYAVNLKGTPKTHLENTGRKLNEKLFWDNFDKVVESGISFYITVTKPDFDTPAFLDQIEDRYGNRNVLEDSFFINIIDYEAIK